MQRVQRPWQAAHASVFQTASAAPHCQFKLQMLKQRTACLNAAARLICCAPLSRSFAAPNPQVSTLTVPHSSQRPEGRSSASGAFTGQSSRALGRYPRSPLVPGRNASGL